MGVGESILHLSLFRCSQVQIHVIWLLCKDGKDVELWQSGVLPHVVREPPDRPAHNGYQTLKTHEE